VDQHGFDGVWSQVGPTLDNCKQLCYNDINCLGFDWDPTNTLGQYCWLFRESSNLGVSINVTHYERIATCLDPVPR